MPKDIIGLIPLTSIASATLTPVYQVINVGGLPNPCFELWITNDTSETVVISVDGVIDHEVVLEGQSRPLQGQQNAGPANMKTFYSKGLVVYAKGTAGTGSVYLSGYYNIE